MIGQVAGSRGGVVKLAVAAEWLGTELEGERHRSPFCAVEAARHQRSASPRHGYEGAARAELKPVDDVKKGRAVEGEQVALDVKRTLAGHHLRPACPSW